MRLAQALRARRRSHAWWLGDDDGREVVLDVRPHPRPTLKFRAIVAPFTPAMRFYYDHEEATKQNPCACCVLM